MNNHKVFYTIVLMLIFVSVNAQVGAIGGKIVNTRGDEIYKPKIVVTKSADGSFVKEVVADKYGNYEIKPLLPGSYNLQFLAKDYDSLTQMGLLVREDTYTHLDVKLKPIDKKKK